MKTVHRSRLTTVTNPAAIESIKHNGLLDLVGAKIGGSWVAVKSTYERWKARRDHRESE